ncbi:MAG: TetR/AcrR family transcriptional regulator [Bacillus sp. (in: firmicutes)]
MEPVRETGTKKRIKDAFAGLLKEKGMNQLTVSDIARKADINRGTFYLHYLDKDDLLNRLEEELLNHVELIFEKHEDGDILNPVEIIPYEVILEVLRYVTDNMDWISALLTIRGHEYFTDKTKHLIGDALRKRVRLSKNLSLRMRDLPQDYAQEILLSSVISIIHLWIRKGAVETPEEIASMITTAKQIAPADLLL